MYKMNIKTTFLWQTIKLHRIDVVRSVLEGWDYFSDSVKLKLRGITLRAFHLMKYIMSITIWHMCLHPSVRLSSSFGNISDIRNRWVTALWSGDNHVKQCQLDNASVLLLDI